LQKAANVANLLT